MERESRAVPVRMQWPCSSSWGPGDVWHPHLPTRWPLSPWRQWRAADRGQKCNFIVRDGATVPSLKGDRQLQGRGCWILVESDGGS